MKKIFYSTSIILLIIHTLAYNQKPYPCGTAPQKSEWLTAFQKNPAAFKTAQDSLLVVPMTIHSVGSDNGGGHYATDRILDAFCTLNEDFEEAGILFYIKDDIQIINNSDINNHTDYYFGGRYMNETAEPNSINTFIVSNPAGNCGYNIFWSHMMLGKNCAGPSDHTWAHEVGHHFSLPHPFLGWEGGQSYDGSIPADFSNPAPEKITYDYTQFYYEWAEDTIIVDTAFVEKVDRSNCEFAADGFCDTPADYIANRWNCNNDLQSSQTQTDPNGEKFQSDGTLIMSYSDDNCARRFSGEQIAAMRAYLFDQRPEVLENPQTPLAAVEDGVQMIYPGIDEAVAFNSVEFQWEEVPNATKYLLQVSRLPSFPQLNVNEKLETNSFTSVDLEIGRTYYWRVRAYNEFSTCSSWSDTQKFTTAEISAVAKIDALNDFKVFPTILKSGNSFSIQIDSDKPIEGTIQILDLTGKVVTSEKIDHQIGAQIYKINTSEKMRGLYLVGLLTERGKVFKKLIVD